MGEQAKAANVIAKEGGLETTSALHDYALQLPQITTQTVTTSVVTVKALHIITGCAHFASLYHGQHDNGHLPSPQVCLRGIGPTGEESPVSSWAELASTADGLSMGASTKRLAVRTLGQCTNS